MNLMFLIFMALTPLILMIGSPSNLDYIKPKAEERWKELGFQVVGYQGHQWCTGGYGTAYGGACVWYELRSIPDNGVTYSGHLKRWGDHLEAYGPIARDAIKPNN